MAELETYHSVPTNSIKVPSDRQRKDLGDIDSLADSIKRIGLLHAIIVTRDMRLVAGERRLMAVKTLQQPSIWVRYLDELTPIERKRVEYEENLKRQNLDWKEDAAAVADYHALLLEDQGEDWTTDNTAEALGMSRAAIMRRVHVAEALKRGDSQIQACENVTAAYRIIERRWDRETDAEIELLIDDQPEEETLQEPTAPTSDDEDNKLDIDEILGTGPPAPPEPLVEEPNVWQGDFLEWAPTYRGERFNLIHADFPYGMKMHKSDQNLAEAHAPYDDDPEIFYNLLYCFIKHAPAFMTQNAHVLFWYSMKFHWDVVQEFRNAGFRVDDYPLVWYKEDKRGLLPDSQRGPRRCYETCLFTTRGDRRIVHAGPNIVAHATADKSEHYTQKPFGMLLPFFRLVCDSSSTFFDPACGSGTALQAAFHCGAQVVKGMDIDPENVETTKRRLMRAKLSV